jgi:hypothetical protein
MNQPTNIADLLKRVLFRGAILILAVGVLGGVIGYLVVGLSGLYSALIGAAMAMLFVSLTALSVLVGGKLNLGGFFAVVMGGWLLKIVIFLILVATLKGAEFINGPTLFITLVASILGSLVLDTMAVTKARIPVVQG